MQLAIFLFIEEICAQLDSVTDHEVNQHVAKEQGTDHKGKRECTKVSSYYLNPTTSRLSLLSHKSKAKLRTSVNNNDNPRVQWDLSGFYPIAFDVYNDYDQLLIVSNKHVLSISFVFKCIIQRNVN